jgi:hypothetical protein
VVQAFLNVGTAMARFLAYEKHLLFDLDIHDGKAPQGLKPPQSF